MYTCFIFLKKDILSKKTRQDEYTYVPIHFIDLLPK